MIFCPKYLLLVFLTCLISPETLCSSGELPKPLQKTEPMSIKRFSGQYEATVRFYEAGDLLTASVAPTDKAVPPLPTAARAALVKPLLEGFIRKRGHPGRLLFSMVEYPELAERIAFAAAKSRKWNLKTGKPKVGSAETVVRDLLADRTLFHELEELWAPLGYRVTVHSVERVLLSRWRELAPAKPAPSDLTAEALVPGGAAIIFQIEANTKSP